MILVKNNTARPIHVNLGADKNAKIPTMKRVTLMPGNNQVEEADAKAIMGVPMVEKMVDEGELVIRNPKAGDEPSAAEKAKALLDGKKDDRTPAQKAADTKAAKKKLADEAEAAKNAGSAPAAPVAPE